MPLFHLGFRPFYLLAGALAMLSVPVWMAQYRGWLGEGNALSGPAWHAHEMVFGFAVAVITGFLFTAARNWTGLPTPTGWQLGALAVLWLSARVALLTGPAAMAVALDMAFLPAVALALWLPLRQTRNRNQFFVGLLLILAAANGVFHAAHLGVLPLSPLMPARFALYQVIIIIAVMGGRVIPSFTVNAVRGARIRLSAPLDRAAIVTAALAFMALLLPVPPQWAAPACALAAVMHGIRLQRWDPLCTRHQPILWILHLSYAWIPLGFALHAAALWGLGVNPVLADHALGTGAVGGIILGMMTRTARGHTGRPLSVGPTEVVAYVLVHMSAVVRALLPLLWPQAYGMLVTAAAALWALAFALFLWVYAPMLLRMRADGRPG